jgi:hypothetical protein
MTTTLQIPIESARRMFRGRQYHRPPTKQDLERDLQIMAAYQQARDASFLGAQQSAFFNQATGRGWIVGSLLGL